jgi:vacuolar-type H+-ATPase subunit I/STV1
MILIGFGLVKRITSLIKMILFRLLEESDERESERKLLLSKEEELDDLRSIIQRLKQEHPEIKI